MRPFTFISFVGFVMLVAATYCPMLHFLLLHSWDVYDLNKPYGMVMLLIFVIGIIGTIFNRVKLTRLAALISLALVVLFYLAALLKVHAAFSFIPFKSISGYLSNQIKFKWGWYLLFAGQLLTLASFADKSKKLF